MRIRRKKQRPPRIHATPGQAARTQDGKLYVVGKGGMILRISPKYQKPGQSRIDEG